MAKLINRLNPRRTAILTEPGMYADGDGLCLSIDRHGAKRWVLSYIDDNRRWEMDLGNASTVTLGEARGLAGRAKAEIALECNLAEDGDAKRTALGREQSPTLEQVMDELVEDLKINWKSRKDQRQWGEALVMHARGLLKIPVSEIDTERVLEVLKPLWATMPKTGWRVRERLARVLAAAHARGYRTGENPASWNDHLQHLLPRPASLGIPHHASLNWLELPVFLAELRSREPMSGLALEFTILTAARAGETLGFVWDELKGDTWVIPPARMKTQREHRIPLVGRAREIVDQLKEPHRNAYVFPGRSDGRLSDGSMRALLLRMKRRRITVHGFRSTFRDWAADCTDFSREVVEIALSHAVWSPAERAYRRGCALEKRKELMRTWDRFCSPVQQDREPPPGLEHIELAAAQAAKAKEAASSLPELMSWIEIGMAEKTAEIRRLHGEIERLSNELETARKQSSPQRSEAKAADLKLAYTVAEVAEATSLSRGTIYRLCKAGRVKWIKIGERRLFLRCDLESFLKTAADNGGAA